MKSFHAAVEFALKEDLVYEKAIILFVLISSSNFDQATDLLWSCNFLHGLTDKFHQSLKIFSNKSNALLTQRNPNYILSKNTKL